MKKEKILHDDELRVNFINSSTNTEGNINCQSSIRFDGKHKGEIHAVNKIVIGEKSIINGNLYADNIEIFGLVKGDCRTKSSITLSASANYSGNIFTKQIIIHEGAIFNGHIEMIFENSLEQLNSKESRINIQSENLLQKIAIFVFSALLLLGEAAFQVGGEVGSNLGAY